MFEELTEPLPDSGKYWDKLGLEKPTGPLDRALLDEIVYAHQCRIPFENLDVFDHHINVSLGTKDLFDKIIEHPRGGFCFELNALFHALLVETGFDSAPCVARTLKYGTFDRPFIHRGEIVTINGEKVYCDVGYGGPMAPCSIPLVDGLELSSHGQSFRIEHHERDWWKLYYLGSTEALEHARQTGEKPRDPLGLVTFLDARMQEADFAVLSYYCATHPDSIFTQQRMLNRRTEDGNVSITADEFTRVTAQGSETVHIESEEQFRQLAKDEFGIVE